jgi:HD-like signal output (HDOD) protein
MYSGSLRPTTGFNTAADLAASTATLLTLPDVYLRVRRVVEDPDSYLTDMVNAISVDPGITARLLRLVNSAYFGVVEPVDNIRKAVNLLGMRPVHDLVLATALTSTLAGGSNTVMDMRDFWVRSVCRGSYSRLLARHARPADGDTLFVHGLLSEIGHQVMYMQIPQVCRLALDHARASGRPLAEVETEMLGFNYADVGGELLRAWAMPAGLVTAVRCQTDPAAAEEFRFETTIVHVAGALAVQHAADFDETGFAAGIAAGSLGRIDMTLTALPAIREAAVAQLDEAAGALLTVDAAGD